MSTKSTLFSTNCCHIYRDKKYQHTDSINHGDDDVLVIDVDYDYVDDQSCIVVEWNSDFAVLIRALLDIADHDCIDKLCRDNYKKRA